MIERKKRGKQNIKLTKAKINITERNRAVEREKQKQKII